MTRVARLIYTAAAWLFVVGVLLQVLFAGMVIVARQWPWTNHVELGYWLGLPILLMLILVFLGRFPRRMKVLTLLLPAVYVVQLFAIWSRFDAPLFSAFHPVMALLDFGLGLTLAWQSTVILKVTHTEVSSPPLKPEAQSGD